MSEYSFVTLGQDNFVDIWSTSSLKHAHTFNNQNKIFRTQHDDIFFPCDAILKIYPIC